MPRAPKALARTGPDALGTGALSNLNSTGAHTARIGSRRPSTDLCFSSIEPHPTTTGFSVPGHPRSSRPGDFRGEGDGRGNRGPIFHCRAPRTPPKPPSIFPVCEAVRALRQKECARGCRQRTAQSRFSISSVHARAVVEHSRAATERVDSPLSDTSRKRTPRRPTNHSRRSACLTLCGSSNAAKRRNAPPDRNSPFARPSRKVSNVSAHAGTGGLRRGACGTDVTLIASTDRGAPCFASLRAVTSEAGKSR